MSAPTELDLTTSQSWRSAPMPRANLPLELVRLTSPRDRLTIHARFPAGFERLVPGGYVAAEEFLLLAGELELEGVTYRRGDLTVVPGRYLRAGMRSPAGCRALAWFGGPADFLAADELEPGDRRIASASTDDAGQLPASPSGSWHRGPAPAPASGGATLDVVTADLGSWRRGADLDPGEHDLVRVER